MAIKKTELYSSLWASCDALRGGMDASQYKDYVLTMLFVKYISDKYKNQPFGAITIPDGASFDDMVAMVGTTNELGDDINKKILNPIKEANDLNDFPDFNDDTKLGKGKEKNDTLQELILIFDSPELDFSKNSAEGDDILGDAYEFLMRHFAQDSGKSKGQFYTPAEVSRVLAKVVGINPQNSTSQTKAYDPTCGSGSLLLKVADEAGKKIEIYGQEKDITTANLAKMNMILHDNPSAEIFAGNTLSSPHFINDNGGLQQFDYIVANPPFSLKNWTTGFSADNDKFGRFKDYGIPPDKNGDYAFLLHIIKSLKSTGKGAVVLPHGVLFRGNAEAVIRKNLINKGYIKAIIGLPPNLFYGTGIPACIIVIDKENSAHRKGIFMIDASKGFVKDGNKNRLREQDLRKITDVYADFSEVEKFSRIVPISEIADEKNDYNLNIPRYIDTQEQEDIQDLYAHLNGGIPQRDVENLNHYWKVFPTLKNDLFEKVSENYYKLKCDKDEVRTIIFEHSEFVEAREKVMKIFAMWKNERTAHFKNFNKGIHPKVEIAETANLLLDAFEKEKLINAYDIYQNLMEYWHEIMQDDVYSIAIDGWEAGNQWERQIIKAKKAKEGKKQAPDKPVDGLKGIIGKMISPELMIEVFFQNEKIEMERWENLVEQTKAELVDMEEEQSGEDGVFADLLKVNATEVKKLHKESKNNFVAKEELELMETYLKLSDLVKETEKLKKAAEVILEKRVIEKYSQLTEAEVKDIVVDKKWMLFVENGLNSEFNRISQMLSNTIKYLVSQYEMTLSQIEEAQVEYDYKIKRHLEMII